MHSINVVDSIAEWKSQMATEVMRAKFIEFSAPFIHKNENYLIKMYGDCQWLGTSNLSRFLSIPGKTDAFLSNVTCFDSDATTMSGINIS
jgi:hypothetical protein